jgi:hypothetical protein
MNGYVECILQDFKRDMMRLEVWTGNQPIKADLTFEQAQSGKVVGASGGDMKVADWLSVPFLKGHAMP